MTEYTKPEAKVYPDADFHTLDEIYAESLEETERDAVLEQIAFERDQERRSMRIHNQMLMHIKRECSHSECRSSQCGRATYYGAIAV
jgi:hypothetical protein